MQVIFMRYVYSLLFAGLCMMILTDCNRVKDPILPHTRLIFPTDEGIERIYYVIDTTYNTTEVIHDGFYRKEQIGTTEQDLLNRDIRRLETFRSEEAYGTNYQFETERVWSIYKDDDFAEEIIENKRELSLKFPVHEDVQWNANQYNDQGTVRYQYQNVDTTVTVNGVDYENCVFVYERTDTLGIINYRLAYSIYAPNIGKIYTYSKANINDGPGGEFNPDDSFIHIETLIEHNQ